MKKVEGGVDNRFGADSGVLGPNVTTSPTSSKTLVGWAKDNPHTWLAAIGPYESINGPDSGHTGRTSEVAANRTEVEPLDKGLYPAANWTKGGQVTRRPLSVAEGDNPKPSWHGRDPYG